jgi:hypothetical protein
MPSSYTKKTRTGFYTFKTYQTKQKFAPEPFKHEALFILKTTSWVAFVLLAIYCRNVIFFLKSEKKIVFGVRIKYVIFIV